MRFTARIVIYSPFFLSTLSVLILTTSSLFSSPSSQVIQEGADLQSEVTTLEDSLRDFTSDLDRLLLG